jgi:hypothetical protein
MLQADAKMGRLNIITTMEMQTMTKYEPCFFGGRSLVLEMEIPGSLVMTAK